MEGNSNLDIKYQNLATEYSKLRANATVLKKAVLDEQARSRELKETLKDHELRLRKSNQEMESLTFRNQQLTKRIFVLQEELDIKTTPGRRSKSKADSHITMSPGNITLLDEELQKKIMDNAQLISAMTDKDLEISSLREIITELEEKLMGERKQKSENEHRYSAEVKELQDEHCHQLKLAELRVAQVSGSGDSLKLNGDIQSDRGSLQSEDGTNDGPFQKNTLKQQVSQLQNQVEHWKTEYELLQSKQSEPCDAEQQRTKDYFYERIDRLMGEKQMAETTAGSLTAECNALQVRLELSLEDKSEVVQRLEASVDAVSRLQEELNTTNHSYEQQLSTMSEHLADLNDKYTEQCEIIQQFTLLMHGPKSKKNAK